MDTKDKLINVKDLNLATSAVLTKVYDVAAGTDNVFQDLYYKYYDLQETVYDLPTPMVFKGSLGTGGTITSLPTASSENEGFTYKVITAGTYASQSAKVGDTFICANTGTNTYSWTLIPSGDEPSGTVTSVTIKATSPIAIDSSSAITTSGTRTLSHANSGVAAGTYRSVTVNATGHVTAGTNPTTISGYGITDAKIDSGVITLGSNTITPLTSSSTLDATKLSGTIPSGCYTDTNNAVTQTATTTSAAYELLFSSTADNTTRTEGARKTSTLTYNPSTKALVTGGTVNGYTLAAASAKGVDTSISAASTSANLPTSAAVATFVEGKGYQTTDTKNTAGSTDSSSKLFLIGATSQAANPQTYSQDTAYVGTDGHLYSNSVQVVNLSGSQALTNKTYNGYTLGAACAKAVVTSIDTSASLPTSNAVKTFVEGKGYVTTDTKNTAGSTDTSSKIYLIGATSQAANPQTYSDNEVYATSGVLTTKSVQVGGTAATMQYNSTDKCIEFVFA